MIISRHYVLAAGGTGGHMIPAYALGQELLERGHHFALVTDGRGAKIPGKPEKMDMHILPAGRMGGIKGSIAGLRAIWKGRAMASQLYQSYEPTAVIGFGGYPALPALLGAFKHDIVTIIHEQNAVLGRVNRLAAHKVNAIATAYPDVQRLKEKYAEKTHLIGNPVREEILKIRDQDYPKLSEDGIFRVLITGGSQGANILSDVVPDGMAMLPINLRSRLQVTQQCRAEDIEDVRSKYAHNSIPAELATYMADLPDKISLAHLIIGRAGASTIAELTAAGRPAVLVPLPSAMDDHQSHNVSEMVSTGGGRAIAQKDFTAKELAKQIQKLALKPDGLDVAAERAKSCGRPDAVKDLADLVESFGASPINQKKLKTQPEQHGKSLGANPAFAKETNR